MGLLTPGYWPTTHWAKNYWHDGYWQDYGLAVAIITASTRFDLIFTRTLHNLKFDRKRIELTMDNRRRSLK